MMKLRHYLFQTLFILWNIILSVGCFWLLLLPRSVMLRFTRFYLHGVRLLFKYVAGTDFQIIGLEHLPETPCIIAAKHLAPWETMILPLLGRSPAIVLKRELMRIPLWGWYARKYGNVPVDRNGGGKAMTRMLAAAEKVIAANRDLLIFPQGTRLHLGEWKTYKIGVAGLYQRLQVPILPVALNSGIFWSRDGRLRQTGTITVEFLPPIPPGLDRTVMMKRLQNGIETASNRLVTAEGGPPVSWPHAEH